MHYIINLNYVNKDKTDTQYGHDTPEQLIPGSEYQLSSTELVY